jgi:hypothetical protein
VYSILLLELRERLGVVSGESHPHGIGLHVGSPQANNYTVYSVKGASGNGPRRISELGSLVSTPWTPKSFIYNRAIISQAGRRRFDPGLPLQLFNKLASPDFKACSKMLQNPSHITGRAFSNASTASFRLATEARV